MRTAYPPRQGTNYGTCYALLSHHLWHASCTIRYAAGHPAYSVLWTSSTNCLRRCSRSCTQPLQPHQQSRLQWSSEIASRHPAPTAYCFSPTSTSSFYSRLYRYDPRSGSPAEWCRFSTPRTTADRGCAPASRSLPTATAMATAGTSQCHQPLRCAAGQSSPGRIDVSTARAAATRSPPTTTARRGTATCRGHARDHGAIGQVQALIGSLVKKGFTPTFSRSDSCSSLLESRPTRLLYIKCSITFFNHLDTGNGLAWRLNPLGFVADSTPPFFFTFIFLIHLVFSSCRWTLTFWYPSFFFPLFLLNLWAGNGGGLL